MREDEQQIGFSPADRRTLAFIAALILAVTLPHIDFIPFFDAGSYYHCLQQSQQWKFSLKNFYCLNHPSAAYFVTLWGLTLGAAGSIRAVNFANALIAIVSCCYLYLLLRRLAPAPERRWETRAIAICYALSPALLAHVFHLNPDFGIMAALPPFLYYLLSGRPVPAAAAGLFISNCKETGVLAYGCAAALYLIFRPRHGMSRARPAGLAAQIAILTLPLAITAASYLYYIGDGGLYQHLSYHQPPVASLKEMIVQFDPTEDKLWEFLADIFVLNFNWLFSLPIAAALARLLYLSAKERRLPGFSLPGNPYAFLGMLFLAMLYVLTRFRRRNYLRYVIPIHPLMLILAHGALLVTVKNDRARRLYLAAVTAFVFAANFRTLDPISLAIFPSFRFGEHTCHEFALNARDQIVYNLEFLNVHYLQNDMFEYIRPDGETLLASSYHGSLSNPGYIDPATFRRTSEWRPPNIKLRYHDKTDLSIVDGALRALPPGKREFYLIQLPSLNTDFFLSAFSARYRLIESRTFERSGYALSIYRFRLPEDVNPP